MSSRCEYEWATFKSDDAKDVIIQLMRCSSATKTTAAASGVTGGDDATTATTYVIIPGNPGCIEFYDKFATSLSERTGGSSVLGISHTGHAHLPQPVTGSHPKLEQCGLEMQIRHKLAYLREVVFKETDDKLILIGHSIGCYVILQMLDRLTEKEQHRISRAFLLFPTIERMSITPNGKRLTPILSKARWIVSLLACGVSSLPVYCLEKLLPFIVKTDEECVKNAVKVNLCNDVLVANSCTFMGLEEMHKVKRRDDDIIEKHLAKLFFYYGSNDAWCPQEYYFDMIEKFGKEADIHLCTRGMEHAFVLEQSDEAAEIVAEGVKKLNV